MLIVWETESIVSFNVKVFLVPVTNGVRSSSFLRIPIFQAEKLSFVTSLMNIFTLSSEDCVDIPSVLGIVKVSPDVYPYPGFVNLKFLITPSSPTLNET